ncbi:MAG: hypothetical protein IT383_03370 [Deltaproteobacteria bacterium]|nr:hypothetical protein [Deltaproteobacteria bacterium]
MFRSLAVMVALALAVPAAAHVGQLQEGRDPFLVDGEVMGGLSTWGIVLPVGSHWERVCEEAIGPVAFFARRRARGDILVGTLEGLMVTSDEGCSYQLLSGALDEHSPAAMVAVGNRLFASTAQYGQANSIYTSDDEGESWQVAHGPVADTALFQLHASADGSHLIATGSRTGASTSPVVLVSVDGGESFQDVSSGYTGYVIVSALGFRENGSTAMISTMTSDNQFRVMAAAAGSYQTPTTIGTLPSEAKSGVDWNSTVWVVTPLAGMFYRKGPADADFVQVSDTTSGPTKCVARHPDGDRLLGCGRQAVGNPGLFMESADGVNWHEIIGFDDIAYRVCPAETAGFTMCATYFESACGNGEDEDFDQLIDCDDEDCAYQCGAEGEGEGDPGEGEGEGEGDPGEGEGEGEPGGCPCNGGHGVELSLLALLALTARRRRGASAG